MMKKMPLMRLQMIENFATWEFNLSHKNIILDSIKVYGVKGVKKDVILDEINIKIHIHPNDLPVIRVSSVEFEKYDRVVVMYDIIQKIDKLIIDVNVIKGSNDDYSLLICE